MKYWQVCFNYYFPPNRVSIQNTHVHAHMHTLLIDKWIQDETGVGGNPLRMLILLSSTVLMYLLIAVNCNVHTCTSYMHACTHACTYAYIHTHMYTYTHAHTYTHAYTYVYTWIGTCTKSATSIFVSLLQHHCYPSVMKHVSQP